MKYWTQLNELDDAVYKVQAVNSGLQILGRTDEMTSADSGLPEEFQTFLADLNDRMDEAVKNLKEKFQDVWGVVREDTFDEDMKAIDELEQEQADKVRFQKIVDGMMGKSIVPIESQYPFEPRNFTTTGSTSNWSIEPLSNGDFAVRDDNMANQSTWVIKEVDGNLTTDYQPRTAQDSFDEEWNFAKRQSER